MGQLMNVKNVLCPIMSRLVLWCLVFSTPIWLLCLDGSEVLPKGEHKLRFSFQLPNGIPASFVGDYGKIAYGIKVTAKREMCFDKSVSWDFTVNNIINLNDDPSNKLPINEKLSHEYYSLLSNKGTFSMNVNIPLAGYVPRQEIIVDCDINNENSQVSVEHILYTFRKITTFKADFPDDSFKVRKENIFNGFGEGVKKGLKSRQILKIELPDSLLPSLQNKTCPITVEYFIKIKAVSSGMHMNFKKYIPINIGMIPVAENMFRDPVPYISTSCYSVANGESSSGPFVYPYGAIENPCSLFITPNPPSINLNNLILNVYNNPSLYPKESTNPSAPNEEIITPPSSPSLAKPPPTYEESLILLADMQLEDKDNNEPSSSLHTDGD